MQPHSPPVAPAEQTKDSAGTLDATSATTATAAAAAPAHGGDDDTAHDAPKGGGEHASNGASNALSLAQGKAGVAERARGGGGEGGAEAVGGFLAGPLSPAQLAPLSVTMEDFMTAVKKVRLVER